MTKNFQTHIKSGILGVCAAALAFGPAAAFAGTLNVVQKGYKQGVNPASTIVIKDASGNVVKEVPYEGGTAQISPITLDAGEYEVSAKADGYVFNVQRGGVNDDVPTNAELIAKKAENLTIQFKADGVQDFSGIKVSLYEGENASGTPKAEATTNAVGKLTFEQVPSGQYFLKFAYPNSIASKVTLPESHNLQFDASNKEAANITIGSDSGNKQDTNQEVGKVQFVVTDKNGKAVEGVELSVSEKATPDQVAAKGTTDKAGKLAMKDLKDGVEYQVKVTKAPSGLTAPAAQSFTYKANEKNSDVAIKFAEAQNAKKELNKTGDINPAVIAGGALGIAVLGTSAAMIARRTRQ